MQRACLFVLLVLVLCVASVAGGRLRRVDPIAALADLPPPPRHHQTNEQQPQQQQQQQPPQQAHDQSLLAVDSTLAVNAQAALESRLAAEAALAVDESMLASAAVEDQVTSRGELSAEEALLVERMIPIPKTSIPSDPAKPLEYIDPPTRDKLATNLGPRGYPWEEKLSNALTTVENAATQRIGQIKKESKWSSAATTLVSQLALKKNKVNAHVAQLTGEIRDLLMKKKQLQNKILQDKLVARLEVTHGNLKKVRRQTHNIRKNQADMIHHKEELAHALEGIKRSLALLKGMKRERQFPSRGVGAKMKDELAKFDPDLSFEKEADEVRQLMNPDAVLAEVNTDVKHEFAGKLDDAELGELDQLENEDRAAEQTTEEAGEANTDADATADEE